MTRHAPPVVLGGVRRVAIALIAVGMLGLTACDGPERAVPRGAVRVGSEGGGHMTFTLVPGWVVAMDADIFSVAEDIELVSIRPIAAPDERYADVLGMRVSLETPWRHPRQPGSTTCTNAWPPPRAAYAAPATWAPEGLLVTKGRSFGVTVFIQAKSHGEATARGVEVTYRQVGKLRVVRSDAFTLTVQSRPAPEFPGHCASEHSGMPW